MYNMRWHQQQTAVLYLYLWKYYTKLCCVTLHKRKNNSYICFLLNDVWEFISSKAFDLLQRTEINVIVVCTLVLSITVTVFQDSNTFITDMNLQLYIYLYDVTQSSTFEIQTVVWKNVQIWFSKIILVFFCNQKYI